jgi:DNA polymerase-4
MQLHILYVDFNSYFASVEQQLRPELRGRPVGVLPVMTESTCCIAASYEAKAFGIRTGTPVMEARVRCPDMVFVEARPALYVEKHHALVAAVESCTPVGKVLSIDEMACPLMGSERNRDKALALAFRIKQTIAREVGKHLRSSIGIAPNTYLAKIASNLKKPDGCTVIEAQDLPEVLLPLDLRALPGIGRAMESRLNSRGITSVRELWALNAHQLHAVWGSVEGRRMHEKLRGLEPVTASHDRASISHSHVLPPDLRQVEGAFSVLNRLLQKAATRLRSHALTCSSVHVYVKYVNHSAWHADIRFTPTDDTLQLLHALQRLWSERLASRVPPLAVGVVLGSLDAREHRSLDLFEQASKERQERLSVVIDAINRRHGHNTLYFGGAHSALAAAPMRIAFQHIPDPEMEGDTDSQGL